MFMHVLDHMKLLQDLKVAVVSQMH